MIFPRAFQVLLQFEDRKIVVKDSENYLQSALRKRVSSDDSRRNINGSCEFIIILDYSS